MSWDSNRTSQPKKSKEEIVFQLRQVNAILEQLAFDSSLTDDFKDPLVNRAIKHWTNEHRLSPDEAAHFQDSYRVVSVLQKINLLQNACRQMGITVPLELFLNRKPELDVDYLTKSFGAEVGASMYHAVSKSNDVPEQGSSPSPIESAPTIKEDTPTSTIPKTAASGEYGETRSQISERDKATSSPQEKKVYGPSNEGDNPDLSTSTADETGGVSSTIFWSTRCKLSDPKFSSKTFLLLTLIELLIIIVIGFFIAYLLKIYDVVA